MKKDTQQQTNKSTKMTALKALLYSSAGIGLVTLITHLADVPKYPRSYGE